MVKGSESSMSNGTPKNKTFVRDTHNVSPKWLQTSNALTTPSSWNPLCQYAPQ